MLEQTGRLGRHQQRCIGCARCGQRGPFLARRGPARHRLNWFLNGIIPREERVGGLATDQCGGPGAAQILRVVRERQRHAHQQVHRILRLPLRHRFGAQQLVFDRRAGLRHRLAPGVHTVGERNHGTTPFAGAVQCRPFAFRCPREAECARLLVQRQRACAGEFGECARGSAICELHLEEAIARDCIAESAIGVLRVRRVHMRHTAHVEEHACPGAHARHRLGLGNRQIAVPHAGGGALHRIQQGPDGRNAGRAHPARADEDSGRECDRAADGADETSCHASSGAESVGGCPHREQPPKNFR